MNIESAVAFAETISGEYSRAELEELANIAYSLPAGGVIVEIGVLYGRSASIFFQAAQERPLELHFVDPWVVNESEAFRSFTRMVDENFRNVPFTLHSMESVKAAKRFEALSINLLHVDGDHSPGGIKTDCKCWLDRLAWGGFIAFHDYTHSDFPQVKETVDQYCRSWQLLGTTDTQARFRK
jgi:hypothetical protein